MLSQLITRTSVAYNAAPLRRVLKSRNARTYSTVLEDRKYNDTHEWIKEEGDDVVSIGITDHAQDAIGELCFVDFPEIGAEFEKGSEIGSIESYKAVSEIYIPVSGTVIEVNESVRESPDLMNSSPYEEGWYAKIKLSNPSELDDLLSASEYSKLD
eukprot:TRINITY_DN85_c0_g2_i1.p1 TRINITY_DN85_c0_g2~~TRINITY_DN85_c0_g2_i1.p1  ORF type:complete len:156 (-),score=43.11 TRINITY_DN85_c0_g2_i1:343-810(-)